jgi:hypothetical protein
MGDYYFIIPGALHTVRCGLALQVNLRHLREHVALLAARLRQHKADVHLPKELQDLEPQVGQLDLLRLLPAAVNAICQRSKLPLPTML